MRSCGVLLPLGAALFLSVPTALVAETREAYLERLRDICSVECMQPRELVRTARKRGSGYDHDMAGIFDIIDVSRWNDKYLLLTQFGSSGLFERPGTRTPLSFRPLTEPNAVVVEMDAATFFDLPNMPIPGAKDRRLASEASAPERGDDGGILVEGDRDLIFSKPTLAKLRQMFINRRIVVRGAPRLEPTLRGARLDYRLKKLTLEVDNADDIVLLPRFDKNGEAIVDGEFTETRASAGSGD
ncbi:MAG: hypothetical protein QNI87_09505 [Erythrobacter sp.]|uniref:hypothetical protein n=1 Tax=Erythrobacter sp. TaxID=1042 RepID=UPI002635C167|nr:hypothetical protein [Erythrobacter sp.]MDJ0978761.1 hypothetical protein [Erythrobacter sp.]